MLLLDRISTFYGKVQILRELSLDIKKGEIVALIGANGAGKTTTVKTISGLIKPATGTIKFFDTQIECLPPDIIAKMGIAHLPQGAGIFQKMTVLENLKLGILNNTNKKTTDAKIEKVNGFFPILEKRKNQLAGTLSGGERQMLGMARAFMSDPRLFIFDEPSFGLSPILVSEIAQIIMKLRTDGATVLLVEQNVRMAMKIADRAFVLETGSIVLQGCSSTLSGNEKVRKSYMGL